MEKLIICLLILSFCSCKNDNKNGNVSDYSKTQIEKKGNTTTEISTDIKQLQKLIDLSKFKPEKIKFKYTFMDNSKGRVPGPSDYFLEAVLYFDDITMERIRKIDTKTDQNTSFQKQDFKFKWLDQESLSELENSDAQKNAHPDFIFGTATGKCWYLKNKILFIQQTN